MPLHLLFVLRFESRVKLARLVQCKLTARNSTLHSFDPGALASRFCKVKTWEGSPCSAYTIALATVPYQRDA